MSIRKKTFLVISLTFLVLLGILFFTARWFLLKDAQAAEQKSTIRDINRLQAALDNQIAAVNATVSDWAPWDATYAFIVGNDPGYIDSNLPNNASFTNIGIELMLFINNSGKIVFGRMVDLESGADIPIPKSLYSQLQSGSRLLSHPDPSHGLAGILSLTEGPLILASQPILTSLAEGPIRGTLIMGRRLDVEEIAKLSQITQLSINAFPSSAAVLPADVSLARTALSSANPIFIAQKSQTVVAGYTLLKDVFGEPAMLLRVEARREEVAQANRSVGYLGLALVAIGILLGLVTMALLERVVITRLTGLNARVMKISNQGTFSSRVQASGNDEIFTLAASVNSMLDSLENSRVKERQNEEKFRNLFNNAEVGMFRTRLDGSEILDVNERFLRIFDRTRAEMQGSASLLQWADPLERQELLRRLEKEDHVIDFECGMLNKHGQVRRCLTALRLYREEGILEGSILDISERVQAEQTLIKTEQIYRQAITSTGGVPYQLDYSDENYVFLGQGFENLTGYHPAEMSGPLFTSRLRQIESFGEQKDLPHGQRVQLSRQGAIDNWREDYLFERKDGTLVWLADQSVQIKDVNGNATGALGILKDITQRKGTEEALRQAKDYAENLIQTANVMVVGLDRAGNVTVFNATAQKISGYTRADLEGRNWFEVLVPKDRYPSVWNAFSTLPQGQMPRIFENPILTRSGEERLIAWQNSELYEQGKLTGLISFGIDITERKLAEQALRQSEAELRALFASMRDAVMVIDRLGVYREIAPTNPALLAQPPEELLGKTLSDVFPAEQTENFLKIIQQVLVTQRTAQIEYDLTIRNQILRFDTSISPMTADSTLWVAHDITRRKRVELMRNAIFRIAQAAITTEGIEALYRSIHSILGELIPVENIYIALYNPLDRSISFPYYIDQFDEPPAGSAPLGGLTGYVIRSGLPLLANQAVFDRLVEKGEVQVLGTPFVDWMGAPLKAEGAVIGVIAVQSYVQGTHYNQEDLNLLEFVSAQVAQAIVRKRMEEEIRNLSLIDELTGLYNRRGFTLLAEEELKLARRNKRSMLLSFADLDGLKLINDTHGHAQGDLALQAVAGILKATFREVDILARIGGDEFVVLAVDASLESAGLLAGRIQSALTKHNHSHDAASQLSLSIGMARFDPEAHCSLKDLIDQADEQMYTQKLIRSGASGRSGDMG